MLKGGRPEECDYCWNVEDANTDSFSDRVLKSGEAWALPHFDNIKNLTGNEDVFPPTSHVNLNCLTF